MNAVESARQSSKAGGNGVHLHLLGGGAAQNRGRGKQLGGRDGGQGEQTPLWRQPTSLGTASSKITSIGRLVTYCLRRSARGKILQVLGKRQCVSCSLTTFAFPWLSRSIQSFYTSVSQEVTWRCIQEDVTTHKSKRYRLAGETSNQRLEKHITQLNRVVNIILAPRS